MRGAAHSEVRFAGIFADGMVLQHRNARIWGWARPGAQFELSVDHRNHPVRADQNGCWTTSLLGLSPGGPYPLSVDGHEVRRVWVGDVWLCAGQSNMERSLAAGAEWPTDPLVFRPDPGIRQLCLPLAIDFAQAGTDHPQARWIGADSAEVGLFSAVGFHFAREIKEKTGVPQGLVLTAVGGSSAQAWLPVDSLKPFPRHRERALWLAATGNLAALQNKETAQRESWYSKLEAADAKQPESARGPWREVTLPGTWASWNEQGSGSAWLRRRFSLQAVPPEDARLLLGTLVDSDDAWVNGVWVGQTGYQYPRRRYPVPRAALREGENELLVRVVVNRGAGAFLPGKPLALRATGLDLDLTGTWEFYRAVDCEPLPPDTFLPMEPVGVRNGMLAPLAGLGIRAVLWYQGESNTEDTSDFGALMRAVIGEFRSLWSNPQLPFLINQLPLFGPPVEGAQPDGWAEVRYQQRLLLQVGHTALAVALDLGDPYDLHPGEKSGVGHRLALAARHLVLQEPLDPWTGPLLVSVTDIGGRIRLKFEQTGKGLKTRDGKEPGGFYVAGADGVFLKARALLSGNEVLVGSTLVPRPLWVRYGWASNPAGANLINSEGLPASPFRTDGN